MIISEDEVDYALLSLPPVNFKITHYALICYFSLSSLSDWPLIPSGPLTKLYMEHSGHKPDSYPKPTLLLLNPNL